METKRISFQHLYDDKWAAFLENGYRLYIVFPQDFQPENSKKYDVQIQWTSFGYFFYNMKDYPVARAYLIDSDGLLDRIQHHINQPKQKTLMEMAFEKAKKKK